MGTVNFTQTMGIFGNTSEVTDFGSTTFPINARLQKTFVNGSDSGEVNQFYLARVAILPSTTTEFNLEDGSLTDPLGVAVRLSILRSLTVHTDEDNADALMLNHPGLRDRKLSIATNLISMTGSSSTSYPGQVSLQAGQIYGMAHQTGYSFDDNGKLTFTNLSHTTTAYATVYVGGVKSV